MEFIGLQTAGPLRNQSFRCSKNIEAAPNGFGNGLRFDNLFFSAVARI
jgi:hypothetical protein